MKGNAVISQSGGPTSVINASVAAIVQHAFEARNIERVFGLLCGLDGLMHDEVIDLGMEDPQTIEKLRVTPSSILGSSRYKPQEKDFPLILDKLKKHNIRYSFQIGGNGSMDTAYKLEQYARSRGYDLRVIGIPKTVDNDLFGTDHAPGYPSAARYVALSVMQAGRLYQDMRKVDQFVIYQSIGRDSGWLTAASVLAKRAEEDAPHLIYTPERRLNKEKFIADFKTVYQKYGWVSVVVSEGLLWENGTPVSATGAKDDSGNVEFGAMAGCSVAVNLHKSIYQTTGLRGEFQITESLPMCSSDRVSEIDLKEAYDCGVKAVELADVGASGVMVSIKRKNSRAYASELTTVIMEEIIGIPKPMDGRYLNNEGNFVTQEFIDYLKPLVGDLPEFAVLRKVKV